MKDLIFEVVAITIVVIFLILYWLGVVIAFLLYPVWAPLFMIAYYLKKRRKEKEERKLGKVRKWL